MTQVSGSKDRQVIITGKAPLVLDDPNVLACVTRGRADLFFITLDETGIAVSRRHITRVVPGQAVPGFAASPEQGRFILTGIGEAQILLESMADRDPAVDLISQWAQTCVTAGVQDQKIPKNYKTSGETEEVFLSKNETLRPDQPGLWITRISGQARYLGLSLADLPLPLPETGWICAQEDLSLTLAPLQTLADAGTLPRAIQSFYLTLARILISRSSDAAKAARRRYVQQREGDSRRMAQALYSMAGILTGDKTTVAAQGLPPLLGACMLAGNAAGITVAEDTFDPESGIFPDLDDIARHNRFRTREVIIAEKWWTQDHGPLLAFRERDNRPVALIPRGSTGYTLADPVTGERKKISRILADELSPKAFTFYRPFPHKPLNWLDLLRFGSFRSTGDFIWLISMGSLAGLLGLLMPLATGLILGTFIPSAAKNDILQITIILVATAIAIAMFNVVKGIATIRLEGRMDLNVQAAVWDRLLALPVPFFKQFTCGDLAVRSMGITAIRQILSGTTLNAVLTLAFTSFNLLFLFYYDWQMAVVAICLTAVGTCITLTAGFITIYFQKSLFEIQGRLQGILLQFISGVNKLRTTGSEERAFAVFAGEYARQKQLNFKAGLVDAGLSAFNAAFPVLVSMVLFAWYYWMRPGHLTVAEFIAFSAAYTTFQTALLQVSMVMPNTANIIPLYQRAKPILQALPEVSQASKKPGTLKGNIQVSHVSFRYAADAPLILDDVSIEANRGEFIAIVGGSGAGKSTLLRLLLGFESPESGAVFYDSQDLKHLDVREVRRQTGVVLQNGKLMNGDIFRNIAGTASLTMDDAWQAARRVGIAEDIEAMPMKMHTMVPAGGGSLSGGQRQRLLIARAVVHKPRILFFDEATSALDNQTQAIVSQSLEQLMVTRIVIAHRLSTIMKADHIYVMDLGRVAESGTYDDLMAQKGLFYELAGRQIS